MEMRRSMPALSPAANNAAATNRNCMAFRNSETEGCGAGPSWSRPARRLLLRQGVDDQGAGVLLHGLVGAAEERGIAVADQARAAGDDRYVLLFADGVADDAAVMLVAVVCLPQLLAVLVVIGMEPAARIRHEHEAAGRRQEARQRRLREVHGPGDLAGDRIASIEMAVRLAARRIDDLELGGDVELGLRLGHRRGLLDRQVHAPLVADLVVEPGRWVIGAGVPADATIDRRAEGLRRSLRQIAPSHELT